MQVLNLLSKLDNLAKEASEDNDIQHGQIAAIIYSILGAYYANDLNELSRIVNDYSIKWMNQNKLNLN